MEALANPEVIESTVVKYQPPPPSEPMPVHLQRSNPRILPSFDLVQFFLLLWC
jgi:hypothetical protein